MISLNNHLDKLHIFVAIADCGSLQGAALQLRTSQPALSLKLRAMEEAVQSQLCTRSVRGIKLTPTGHLFYGFCKKVLADANQFSLALHPKSSLIRIASYDFVIDMIAQDILQSPQLKEVGFFSASDGLPLLEKLQKNEIDLAIVADPPKLPGLTYQVLKRSPYGLYATKSFRNLLRRRSRGVLEEVRRAPLVYLPGAVVHDAARGKKNPQRKTIESFIEMHSLGMGKRIKVDSHLVARQLALQGQAVALLLTGHNVDLLQGKRLVPVSHPSFKMPESSTLYITTKSIRDSGDLEDTITAVVAVFERSAENFQIWAGSGS